MLPLGVQAPFERLNLGEFSLELRAVADSDLRSVGKEPPFFSVPIQREGGKTNPDGIGAP